MSYGRRKYRKFLDCDVNVPKNPRVVRSSKFFLKEFQALKAPRS
jgi:hypothetical protein